MKNKIISSSVFLLLAYIIPLFGNYRLILSIQVLLLAALLIILFSTQPPLSLEESKKEKGKDHSTVWVIILGCLFSQIFSVVEWAYFRKEQHIFSFDYFTTIGLLLLFAGTVFRIWCIKTLGKYFTGTVQTQANQQVISSGAYSLIRHPSYLGAYLAVVGSSILLHAYIGIFVSFIIMFVAYWYRIKAEEKALVKEFGDAYRNYQTHTKKLLPFIY